MTTRLGAAVGGAVDRQVLRGACETDGRVELALAASTGGGLLARSASKSLDAFLVEAELPDAAETVRTLLHDEAVGPDRVVVLSKERLKDTQRLDLPGELVLEAANIEDGASAILDRLAGPRRPVRSGDAAQDPATPTARRSIVLIGSSTGGPDALAELLSELPADFPAPIVVVQHMPPDFTALLAERLNRECRLEVAEVTESVTARPGQVWIAPGHRHVVMRNAACVIELDDGPEVKNCRPSVDVLFDSAVRSHGRLAVAVMLTGMGDDGADATERLAAAGAYVIAQDEPTSVVWGMPGAIVRRGLVDEVLPLRQIAQAVTRQFPKGPTR